MHFVVKEKKKFFFDFHHKYLSYLVYINKEKIFFFLKRGYLSIARSKMGDDMLLKIFFLLVCLK
jgi:hypothetical protein